MTTSEDNISERRRNLKKEMSDDLTRVRQYVGKWKNIDLTLSLIRIAFGGLATMLAGGSAGGGEDVIAPMGGWRATCGWIAAFSGVGLVAGLIHTGLKVTDRVSRGLVCLAKLRDLIDLIDGTGDLGPVQAAYQSLRQNYIDEMF